MEIQNYTEPTHESLTKIVEAVGEAKVTSCLASCDAKYFSYNGKVLDEIRKEKECSN